MSIRLRVAAFFTVAAAVLFALGAWIFAAKLASSLLTSLDAQLAAQVSGASQYLTAGGEGVPASGNLALGETVVQLIDSSGRVRGPEAGGAPLLPPSAIRRARSRQIAVTTAVEDEHTRGGAAPLIANPARPGWIAVAAVSLDSYDGTLSDVRRNLIVGAAVFVAV